MPKKILLQTTIPSTADDWGIARFALLSAFLDGQMAANGSRLFAVTARDRDRASGPDAILSKIDKSEFNELWLFAVDNRRGSVARAPSYP